MLIAVSTEIYSDSQSVIKSLTKRITKNEIINDCHISLNNLARQNNVNINWIPGHQGFEGNEQADKLAKEGSKKLPTLTTYNKIPFRLLYKKLHDHYNETIINRYKNSGISPEAQIITNELLKKAKNSPKTLANNLLKLTPPKLSYFTQILSNHNPLNYHNTKCNLAYNQYCDYCTEVMKECDPSWETNCLETSFHMIYKCKYFSNLRRQIFLKHTIKVNELFNTNLQSSIMKILEFTYKAKFFEKTPKIRKSDLSPNRIISTGKRRRHQSPSPSRTKHNPTKRSKKINK